MVLLVLLFSEQHSSTDVLALVLLPIYIALAVVATLFLDVIAGTTMRTIKVAREFFRDERRL